MKRFNPEAEPMRIAPQFSIEEWKALSFTTDDDWQKGIDILEDRIQGRFLWVIKSLESYTYAGFAVLALDCLLIENLQQFREGVPETPRGDSEIFFKRFLTETSFKKYFDQNLAKMFYKQIRCGILHQAEIKGSSRVFIRQDVPLVQLAKDKKGLIINRKLFHNQLVNEFRKYVSQLRKSNPPNKKLRSNFRKKMDYICRV